MGSRSAMRWNINKSSDPSGPSMSATTPMKRSRPFSETGAVSAPAPPDPPPLPSIPPSRQGDNQANDPDPANPRLLVNRACIYERHLPGDAYITAHVQRLQHGYFSCPTVSDKDSECVDFLAINFVFHSPNTLAHRFMAATIRASVSGNRKLATSSQSPSQPRFLMHAPHLIYGAVSPETLQWRFGIAGSLGVSELPVSASLTPSGGVRKRYRRYEMMRIQGSARTLKSPLGRQFDVESGEVVWSLEENALQKSGLPREFTFAMLVQKPRAESRVQFSLDIEPVVQSWYGRYPGWWLALPMYQPVQRRPVDFRQDIGQRFGTGSSPGRGRFNFATLENSFEDYVHMPGRRNTSGNSSDGGLFEDDHEIRPEVTRDMAMVEPTHRRQPLMPSMHINPTNPMPMTLNVRLLFDTTSVNRERKRRMSTPEKPADPGYRPLRRTRSGGALYQVSIK